MAKSPKKQNVAGSDLGTAVSTFAGLTSGNPLAVGTTFTAAFGPMFTPGQSNVFGIGRKTGAQLGAEAAENQLALNEERRIRKEQEFQEKKEAERKKKEQQEKERLERTARSDKATKERTLEKDTKRISAGLVTQQEALQTLKTGEPPKPRSYSRFEEAELNSAFTRRRRRSGRRSKVKGGGTKKVCLPKAKVMNMSPEERRRVVSAKRSAANKGKYKRSSKSNVKGARKKGATLRDWFQKENWVQVSNPSKKCGEA
tara:strand:- start:905 stop:1675 length:771 start_codon:yes stop_codon:yes gene_type:complete